MLNVRGAQPVVDFSIKKFIENLDCAHHLYSNSIKQEFVENFVQWIQSSKYNNVLGIDAFKSKTIVAGTLQTFDHFYWKYKHRRFRFFHGEFMYHSAFLKNGGNWSYLNDTRLDKNDAVIISVPFSDYGSQRNDMEFFLHNCNAMNIPVLLDFAYYPCSKNINLDLNCYPCVETITFSISKAFYGAEYLRVGIRLQRENIDDGIDTFNQVNMINKISLSIANSLITNYTIDHNWKTYYHYYEKICTELNLTQTDCIMFGLGGKEYNHLNRGNATNRVCISEYIGREINGEVK